MARVGGINIPDNKHIDVSLTHIYGIGRKRRDVKKYLTQVFPLFGYEANHTIIKKII